MGAREQEEQEEEELRYCYLGMVLWHGKSGIAIDATLFILIIGRGRSSAMTPEESVFFFFS